MRIDRVDYKIEKIKNFHGDKKINLYQVFSEPGDATRYEYLVLEKYDDFFFIPFGKSFPYPQHINYWDVKDWNGSSNLLDHGYDCNSYTLAECIRTVLKIYEVAKCDAQ